MIGNFRFSQRTFLFSQWNARRNDWTLGSAKIFPGVKLICISTGHDYHHFLLSYCTLIFKCKKIRQSGHSNLITKSCCGCRRRCDSVNQHTALCSFTLARSNTVGVETVCLGLSVPVCFDWCVVCCHWNDNGFPISLHSWFLRCTNFLDTYLQSHSSTGIFKRI